MTLFSAASGSGRTLKIGNKVSVAAQSGVMHDIPDGQKMVVDSRAAGSPGETPNNRIARIAELLRRVQS